MTNESLNIRVFSFLKINILFFPIIIASILGRYFSYFAASYACALIHELTHIVTAYHFGVGISCIEILPFGICAKLKSEIIKNPIHEILISIAGPISNLILALLAVFTQHFFNIQNEMYTYFLYCNIAMAGINIIPALPLDGGRVLRATLSLFTGSLYAYSFTSKVSRIPIFLLFSSFLYMLFTNRFNFSLILICVFLLSNLCIEQKNLSRIALREMMHYDKKLKDTELSRTSVITAHKSTPARKILKHLSYNNYHIIHVVDDNLRISKTLTEGQLLQALTKRGIRITLGEI